MKTIGKIRAKIHGEIFDYQVLLDTLSGYRKPRDKITRLLAAGAIVRIKKGLYCSYISIDYALSYYGLIPERVETITSVTTRRSRDFDTTPFGAFSYHMLKLPRYAVGAVFEIAGNIPYLVASPEKALVDKVWTDKRFSGRRISDFDDYLCDDLRIDWGDLSKLDYDRLQAIARAYDSAKINNLVRHLKRLKGKFHA
jgi:hypothetical protein